MITVDPVHPLQDVVPPADKTDLSKQELEFQFNPLFEEYFSTGNQGVQKSTYPTDNSKQKVTQPTANVQQPSTSTTNVNVEDNNIDQAEDASFQQDEFINPFCTPYSKIKNIKEAMADSAWIEAMQEELHQFDRLQVWELVDKPFGKIVIKPKWLWKNKKDEDQTVIRNKARLVAKGFA
ncbi:hypothetical protein Tco_1458033 [Tanacetum coccineum]